MEALWGGAKNQRLGTNWMNLQHVCSEQDIAKWFEGKSLTTDWTSSYLTSWAQLLLPLRDYPANILEIGSWEGRSALFFLNYLFNSHITCVDTFGGSKEHKNDPQWISLIADIEKRFDENLAAFSGRVEKLKSTSMAALIQLGLQSQRFDLIYIDGSHVAADVYCDAVLAWSLLKLQGILIFDDYQWAGMPDELDRPKLGIDAFMSAYVGQYQVLT